MKKLYVGNLSHSTTDDGLRSAFAAFGNVTSANVVRDKFSGASRGFGFVEMEDAGEATNAINGLNGKELDGRTLTVNEARPQTGGNFTGAKRRFVPRGNRRY
jgi:RNA recognition motif-containing protein